MCDGVHFNNIPCIFVEIMYNHRFGGGPYLDAEISAAFVTKSYRCFHAVQTVWRHSDVWRHSHVC